MLIKALILEMMQNEIINLYKSAPFGETGY